MTAWRRGSGDFKAGIDCGLRPKRRLGIKAQLSDDVMRAILPTAGSNSGDALGDDLPRRVFVDKRSIRPLVASLGRSIHVCGRANPKKTAASRS